MNLKRNLLAITGLVLITIIAIIADTQIIGLTFAIVGGMYTPDMTIFRRGLGKKMEQHSWLYSKWSKLTSIIDVKKFKDANSYAGASSLKATGNLIDVVKDFERDGGLYMDVPIRLPLIGQGLVGSQTIRGNEEKRRIATKKVAINQLMHAVTIQDNKMSRQTLQKPQIQMALMESGASDLQDWFTRKLGFFPYQAILQGYSDNLTNSTFGVGKTQKSNPNFYVQGTGKMAFSNLFNAAYETAVAAGLATLVNGNVALNFSAKSVHNMVYLANTHKIQPMNIGGKALYIIFITPAQAYHLKRDAEFIADYRGAGQRGDSNVLFTGAVEMLEYDGALLIVDATIPCARIAGDSGYDATRGTVNYGTVDYMASPRDFSSRKLAILCGQGSITAGYGSELGFTHEIADYGQFAGDEADMIIGMERADIIDDDNYLGLGAGACYENVSTLVYATYDSDVVSI